MKLISSMKIAIAAGALTLCASVASAAPCTNAGATLTKVDGVAYGPVDANACEEYAGNIGAGMTLLNELNAGNVFTGEFAAGTMWTFAGKDETSGNSGADVEADVGSSTGSWLANFAPAVLNNVVVALKGGQGGSVLFLFKEIATAGSLFEGTFDMQAAGLVNKKGIGQDLSNLTVAGVFVKCAPNVQHCVPPGGVVPVPAGLPLILSALGVFGIVSSRKRKAA